MIFINDHEYGYGTPVDLRTNTPFLRKVLLTSSCTADNMPLFLRHTLDDVPMDFINVNHGGFLPEPQIDLNEYDFQIAQIPLRASLPEGAWMRIPINDTEGFEKLFEDTCRSIDFVVNNLMAYSFAVADGPGVLAPFFRAPAAC